MQKCGWRYWNDSEVNNNNLLCELNWSSSIILFTSSTWPSSTVTINTLVLFIDKTVTPRVWTIWCTRPPSYANQNIQLMCSINSCTGFPLLYVSRNLKCEIIVMQWNYVGTCGFVRSLGQESSNLFLASVVITGCAKATERASSGNESVISVESAPSAASIVSVFKHLIEERRANECGDVTTGARCWSWGCRCRFGSRFTLTLATFSAIRICVTTPPKFAAT